MMQRSRVKNNPNKDAIFMHTIDLVHLSTEIWYWWHVCGIMNKSRDTANQKYQNIVKER